MAERHKEQGKKSMSEQGDINHIYGKLVWNIGKSQEAVEEQINEKKKIQQCFDLYLLKKQ